MPTALVTKQFAARFGDALQAAANAAGKTVSFIHLPEAQGARLSQAACDRIDCAYLDRDMRFDEQLASAYEDAIIASGSIKWIHTVSSGVNQAPSLDALRAKGGVYTTSTGSNAEPVAQTGFTGLLMLARGFGTYMRGQHRHEWLPLRGAALPDDLREQTLLLIGVGAVGKVLTRYARAFGLKVIGVRRSARTPEDTADELHHPSQLAELLPRADWIVIACPLTRETRNLLNADMFRCIRKGACLINIARGEIVDENAMIAALKSGELRGAHLDAHAIEPLPKDSPLWDMPNVIVSPHNASASTGNEKRAAEMFIENFGRWLRGEPMLNVQNLDAE